MAGGRIITAGGGLRITRDGALGIQAPGAGPCCTGKYWPCPGVLPQCQLSDLSGKHVVIPGRSPHCGPLLNNEYEVWVGTDFVCGSGAPLYITGTVRGRHAQVTLKSRNDPLEFCSFYSWMWVGPAGPETSPCLSCGGRYIDPWPHGTFVSCDTYERRFMTVVTLLPGENELILKVVWDLQADYAPLEVTFDTGYILVPSDPEPNVILEGVYGGWFGHHGVFRCSGIGVDDPICNAPTICHLAWRGSGDRWLKLRGKIYTRTRDWLGGAGGNYAGVFVRAFCYGGQVISGWPLLDGSLDPWRGYGGLCNEAGSAPAVVDFETTLPWPGTYCTLNWYQWIYLVIYGNKNECRVHLEHIEFTDVPPSEADGAAALPLTRHTQTAPPTDTIGGSLPDWQLDRWEACHACAHGRDVGAALVCEKMPGCTTCALAGLVGDPRRSCPEGRWQVRR